MLFASLVSPGMAAFHFMFVGIVAKSPMGIF